MKFYTVKVTTGTTLSFQVEADTEEEAREIMEDAMNKYPDEIYDTIDAYGDVETTIVDFIPEDEQWPGASEAAPGIFY